MVAEDFILAKQNAWERLDYLTKKAQSNIVVMDPQELQELGRLYRQTTSDLAHARRDYPGHSMSVYLNDLVAQGHSAIYREQHSSVNTIRHYFAVQLPQAFRQLLPFIIAALCIFCIPVIIGWVIAAQDPNEGVKLMPELNQAISHMQNDVHWWEDLNEDNAGGSAFILTNNIWVSFQALLGGLLVGVVSIYILYQNGLMLGIIAGAAQNIGFSEQLWGFVTAHAVVELSIIVISGGAGLSLAWAILHPGLNPRRVALRQAISKAFRLSGAIIIFLIMAGLIEGFISPSNLPYWFKLSVAIISGLIMYSYLIFAGRNVPSEINQPQ